LSVTVSAGRTRSILSGLAIDTTLSFTGDEVVSSGGNIEGQEAFVGGAAFGTTVGGGEIPEFFFGGTTVGSTICEGGGIAINTTGSSASCFGPVGDRANETVVLSGGTAYVEPGATGGSTILSGGTEIVASGGIVSGTVTFVSSGELILEESTTFGGTIFGLSNTSEKLDLADISFGSTTSMTYSGNTQSGTLTS
jgi:autotransporter passenger strand-loop-strand repeat protein